LTHWCEKALHGQGTDKFTLRSLLRLYKKLYIS